MVLTEPKGKVVGVAFVAALQLTDVVGGREENMHRFSILETELADNNGVRCESDCVGSV